MRNHPFSTLPVAISRQCCIDNQNIHSTNNHTCLSCVRDDILNFYQSVKLRGTIQSQISVPSHFNYPTCHWTSQNEKRQAQQAHRVSLNIGIKHGFSCINIRQVPWEELKTKAEGLGFQHLPRDLANVNALKNHVRSL